AATAPPPHQYPPPTGLPAPPLSPYQQPPTAPFAATAPPNAPSQQPAPAQPAPPATPFAAAAPPPHQYPPPTGPPAPPVSPYQQPPATAFAATAELPDQQPAAIAFPAPPVSPYQQPPVTPFAATAPPNAPNQQPAPAPAPAPAPGDASVSVNQTPASAQLARRGPTGPEVSVPPPGGITSVAPAGSTPVPAGATPWGSAERAAIIERLAATPRALQPTAAVAQPPVRGGRGAVAAMTAALAMVATVGGPTVLSGMLERTSRPWLRELITVQFFAHWTTRPASAATSGTDANQAALWIGRDGPATAAGLVPDEAMLHWLCNFGRIALLAAGIGVGVRLVLRGQRTGALSRALASWAAIGGAAAFAGALSSVVFTQLSAHESITALSALVDGAGFGAQWALLAGLPLGMLTSFLARPAG
ncbi:MAG: hypothetical protein ACKV2O_21885, partial [Acidimicrobiales bacterium]